MQTIHTWISTQLGVSPETQTKIWTSIIVALLLWLLHELSHKFIGQKLQKATRQEYYSRKITSYTILLIGIVLVGRVWIEGFESIGTIIGFASAGLALALKEPITNLAGWIYIAWQKPFSVGDRIEVNGVMGDVVDLRMMEFAVMEIRNWVSADQHTARMVHIPNGVLFTKPLHNYTNDLPYLWDEVAIRLTFESNWEKAKEIVENILSKHVKEMCKTAQQALENASHHFLILSSTEPLEPNVYTRVEEFGILLHGRYIVDYAKRRSTTHAIWEDILRAFDKETDIDFAYPTRRVFSDQRRGNTKQDLPPDRSLSI